MIAIATHLDVLDQFIHFFQIQKLLRMSEPTQDINAENSASLIDSTATLPSSSNNVSGSTQYQKPRTPRACTFFANGNCRNGNECRFSHDPAIVAQFLQQQTTNQYGKYPSSYGNGNSPKNHRNQTHQHGGNHGHYQQQQPLHQQNSSSPTTHQLNLAPAIPAPMLVPGGIPPAGVSAHVSAMPDARMMQAPYFPMQPTFPMPQAPMYGAQFGGMQHSGQPTGLPYHIVQIPPGQPVFSIDVECVATGVQHNSRSVAQVALVNEWCDPVFNAYIKQDKPVASYLTELTGITKEILESQGRPLADVMAELRNCLPPNAILVGQSIHKDVQWLQLADGVDYGSMINLARLFRVWNPTRASYTNFSQDHCAKVWLGMGERSCHDALTDATISMSLFNMYRQVQLYPPQMIEMQQRTLNAPRVPGFSKLHPVIDGCCMGNRNMCNCGAPFE